MRLLMMGPPGAGKGTQATVIARELGIPHISTGDIFRANVSEGTALGQEAQRYMDAGEYVPDDVTNAMVRVRIAQPDCAAGFLLDGYPRTIEQVQELDDMLTGAQQSLDRVIELTVDTDAVVARLLQRAAEGGRADDSEEVIRRRLEVYSDQTKPLIDHYAARRLLVRVDGMGQIPVVTSRVLAALAGDLPDAPR